MLKILNVTDSSTLVDLPSYISLQSCLLMCPIFTNFSWKYLFLTLNERVNGKIMTVIFIECMPWKVISIKQVNVNLIIF